MMIRCYFHLGYFGSTGAALAKAPRVDFQRSDGWSSYVRGRSWHIKRQSQAPAKQIEWG